MTTCRIETDQYVNYTKYSIDLGTSTTQLYGVWFPCHTYADNKR